MTIENRVNELLKKMTVEEKVKQLSCTIPMTILKKEKISTELMKKTMPLGLGRMTQYATGFFSGANSAAKGYNDIQKFQLEETDAEIPTIMQIETAAGVVAKDATIFPVPIAVASTFEPHLAKKMGEVISKQSKAIGCRQALSPVADVSREFRWGRVGETFGEDPYLVSDFSVNEVKGIQGDFYGNNVISCAKHFLGYASSERGINCAQVPINNKELFDVYGTPFHAMIQEADLESVMVTYSEIDGQPMSVNPKYVNKILKEDMGFKGVAICDGMSIPKVFNENGMGLDISDIGRKALKAGIDADTPVTSVYQTLTESIENGLLDIKNLDDAVGRILTEKINLGLFESPFVDDGRAVEIMNSCEGDDISKKITEKEVVLLKNDGILPLLGENKKIGLVGPFADRLSTLFGGYAYPSFIEMLMCALNSDETTMQGISEFFAQYLDFDDCREKLQVDTKKSLEENMQNYLKREYNLNTLKEEMMRNFPDSEVLYSRGISAEGNDDQKAINEAVDSVKDCDVIFATLGEITGFGADATSGEGMNNPDLNLPGKQEDLLKALVETGKPVVLILFNGRPLSISYAAEKCAAILEVWYPGPFGGEVISKIIKGDLVPEGKLPVSFPRNSNQCPIYYGHKAGSGYRSVRFRLTDQNKIKNDHLAPLFHFGQGLSYTSFELSNIFVSKNRVNTVDTFEVSVEIKNTGKFEGAEVVQVYFQNSACSVVRPVLELKAYAKVKLRPNESKRIVFHFDTSTFGFTNADDHFVVEPSILRCFVGTSSIDLVSDDTIRIEGEVENVLTRRKFFTKYDVEIVE